MKDGRLPLVVLAVGVAAITAFLVAPSGSGVQTAAWFVPFGLAAALLAARTRLRPAGSCGLLRFLLAGQLLYLVTSGVWYVAPVHFDVVLPFPSPLDAAFFGAYTLYAAFLVGVLRRRARDRGLESRLSAADAAILTIGMSAVLWVTVIHPNLSNGISALSTAVAVVYPAFQLVLFALGARLVVGVRRSSGGPVVLLILWLGASLAGDVIYGFQSANGTFDYRKTWLIAAWMVSYSALAAFAAHPGVGAFLQPGAGAAEAASGTAPRLTPRPLRLVALLLSASVPLVLAAFTTGHDPVLMAAACLTFALALYRALVLAGDLAEQRRLGAELEHAMATLHAQHRELARLAAVVASTSDAVITCSTDGVVLDWNASAERLFGYPRAEAIGRHVTAFLPAEAALSFAATRALVLEQGSAHVEREIVRKDGSTAQIETALSPVHDETGALCGIVGMCRDVTERAQLQRERAAQADRLDEAQRIAGVGSWAWDLETDHVLWSDELYRMFRLSRDVAVSPALFLGQVHPQDRPAVQQHLASVGPERPLEYETRIVRPDGDVRWLAIRGEVQLDAAGRSTGVRGTAQDITDRVLLQHDLAGHVRRLDEAQRLAGVGSFEQDVTTGRDVWSGELYRILDLDESTGAASYETYLERLHPEDRPHVERQNASTRPGQPIEYETRIIRSDGEIRWARVRAEVTAQADGSGRRVSGTVHDISAQKATELELERLARTDSLTGLANRERFGHLLQTALDEADAEQSVGVLLLDLDGFKDVNDGLGHHVGDRVLQEVARRLTSALRPRDVVARLGGDEFAVVLPAIAAVEEAVVVADRILSALEPTFDLDGMAVRVGGSVGITAGERSVDPATLLQRADVAMYRAKTLPARRAVFAPEQDDLASDRLGMVADLRASIEQGDLEVAYQPILDTSTGQVSSFEALARWRHPRRGAIAPDQFIPLAEQADLIVPLTQLVLRRAAQACVRWRRAGHDVRVAVNLSVQVLETDEVSRMVTEELATAGLDPRQLILEITESALATEGDRIKASLDALRSLGVTLAIDDFGTGYSAMSYLKQLPVAELKIDRSFVREIATDARDLSIVRSLIQLAHSLSLRVVAEGVESAAALTVLKALGCDFAQGYGIARPMPEADTAAWLAQSSYVEIPAVDASRAEPSELLIVDDNTVVRAHLTALAAQAGWRVREASSAEQALLEVERAVPDVVILDHHMTGMTGMDAVPELRRRGLDGPILLFTGFLSDALPSMRVPLDVWPVSKSNPAAVFDLLAGYRATTSSESPTGRRQSRPDSAHIGGQLRGHGRQPRRALS